MKRVYFFFLTSIFFTNLSAQEFNQCTCVINLYQGVVALNVTTESGTKLIEGFPIKESFNNEPSALEQCEQRYEVLSKKGICSGQLLKNGLY